MYNQQSFQEFIGAFYNPTEILTYLFRIEAVICALFIYFSWIKNTVTYNG